MDFVSVRKQAAEAMAICRNAGTSFVLKLPRITRDEYLSAVLPEIVLLHQEGLAECIVENTGTAYAVRMLMHDMVLSGGAGLNIFNHRSACHLSPLFRSFTLSPELFQDDCRDLIQAARTGDCKASFTLIVQGTSEAMITEDCISEPVRQCWGRQDGRAGKTFTGIRDATGRVFPIHTDGECRTHIGNAAEICLIDYLPAIRQAGISEVVIDTRGRTGAYAGTMTQIYLKAIDLVNNGAVTEKQTKSLKDRIKTLACGGITTGHFLRGLKE
jgi:putative protease